MTKELQKEKRDDFYQFIDDLKTIIAERKFNAGVELVQMKHEIGEAIIKNPLYQEGTEGAGRFIKRVAEELGNHERDVYYCVQFCKKFPQFETALQTVDPESKGLAWRNVIQLLGGGKDDCGHAETFEEVWKITSTKCRSCGDKTKPDKREKEE